MSKWKHGENPYEESIGAVFDLGNNQDLHGRIALDQEALSYASTTRIFENKLFSIPSGSDLHGISERGRVSLLSCYGGAGVPRAVGDDREPWVSNSGGSTSVNLKSEYAVFGNEYLTRRDSVIRGMRFAFDDFHIMLDDPESRYAFGSIVDPDPRIIEAIEEHKPSYAPSLDEADTSWVFYFNGKYDVLPVARTALGSIGALRDLHVTMSGGTIASDAPYMNLDFDDKPVTLDGAVERMNTVRQFVAWIIGYAPKWKDVRVFKGKKPSGKHHRIDDDGNPDRGFNVFTSHFGGTAADATRVVTGGGHTLISPSQQPDHFMEVMKNWLTRNSDRARPNRTFFASTRGMFTTVVEDRMCAAANVFDQLPVSDRPKKSKRAKMLNVAHHRYRKVIRPQLGSDFELPRMEDVIESAVSCRKHITHGSTKGKTHGVDYSDLGAVGFLTDALRFVYGVAELLECGWDMAHWLQLLFKRDHPFGRFLESYNEAVSAVMPQKE